MSKVLAHCLTIDKSAVVPLTAGDMVFKRQQNSVNPSPLIITGPGGFANTVHVKEQHTNKLHKYVAGHALIHGHEVHKPALTFPKLLLTITNVEKLFAKATVSQNDPNVSLTIRKATPLLNEVKHLTQDMPESGIPDAHLNELHAKLLRATDQLVMKTGGARKTLKKRRSYRKSTR